MTFFSQNPGVRDLKIRIFCAITRIIAGLSGAGWTMKGSGMEEWGGIGGGEGAGRVSTRSSAELSRRRRGMANGFSSGRR